MLSRRGLIGSLISLAAAPAIVRASSLMPIKPVEPLVIVTTPEMMQQILNGRINDAYAVMRKYLAERIYGDLGEQPVPLKTFNSLLVPGDTLYMLQESAVPFDLSRVFTDGRR